MGFLPQGSRTSLTRECVLRNLGGPASIRSADSSWPKLEDALGRWQDLRGFPAGFDPASRRDVTPCLHAITFWASFTQKGRTTPKTLIAKLKSGEPLAPAVLNPEEITAEGPRIEKLTRVFCPTPQAVYEARPDNGTVMPPFVSPFGPRILDWGLPYQILNRRRRSTRAH